MLIAILLAVLFLGGTKEVRKEKLDKINGQ